MRKLIYFLGEVQNGLEKAINQWDHFDTNLAKHTDWCRQMEALFKDLQVGSTLEEKKDRIEALKEKREEVVKYESNIDIFVDESHALVRTSGVERLKPLITQLSNRYQSLHVLTKESVTKWCNIVGEHQEYDDKLEETAEWLDLLDTKLQFLLDVKQADEKESALKYLLNEKEQASQRLATLSNLGERLYPDTATAGREKIRQDLRYIRERWESIEKAISEQQRHQETQSMQVSSFHDSVQAARNWLDSMEKVASIDTSVAGTIQEIRSRQLKLKVSFSKTSIHRLLIFILK